MSADSCGILAPRVPGVLFPSIRVLLVEDDDKLGRQVADGLSGAGFSVEWAKRGDEALAADFASFALVILDLMLPARTGSTC